MYVQCISLVVVCMCVCVGSKDSVNCFCTISYYLSVIFSGHRTLVIHVICTCSGL